MSESYFNVDLNDPRASDIAEVLSNKSCKSILALLAEHSDISESEIALKLGMPLNTVGYNMKKLMSAGFVEKDSGFFWSSKGKRIPKYHLANKKILISPKKLFNSSTLAAFLIGVFALIAVISMLNNQNDYPTFSDNNLKQFSSASEYYAFINNSYDYGYDSRLVASDSFFATGSGQKELANSASSDSGRDFSVTNVQVQGVDEADIVKTDGTYVFTLSRFDNRLYIVKAYPAEEMKIVANISLANGARDILLGDDKLIVIGSSWDYSYGFNKIMPCFDYGCGVSKSQTEISVYDISNRDSPTLVSNISYGGNYIESRMIDNYVYLISEESVNAFSNYPVYSVDGIQKELSLDSLYYFPGNQDYVFTNIGVLNLDDNQFNFNSYMISWGQARYVSENNLYLVSRKQINQEEINRMMLEEVYFVVLPMDIKESLVSRLNNNESVYRILIDAQEQTMKYSNSLVGIEKSSFDSRFYRLFDEFYFSISKKQDFSVIHKFSISDGEVEYLVQGEVPGHLLNQFSLDEYDGDLRVATTIGDSWGEDSTNNIYVLDDEMDIVGKIEGLAPNERIYSARFLGERAYLVTFKNVDPFFVIDLSDSENPEVLGYLKIPGYSNYLHPYNKNYVIGIGKDVVESQNGLALPQGLKIALFDVRDVNNPVEVNHVSLGDRGTDSQALYDHKAFLFDKSRNLLVLPVNLAEINKSLYGEELPEFAYGQIVWQGAYVFNISEEGVFVRGRVTHNESDIWNTGIERSMFIEDILYTVSDKAVQANNLADLNFIEKLEFYDSPQRYYYGVESRVF